MALDKHLEILWQLLLHQDPQFLYDQLHDSRLTGRGVDFRKILMLCTDDMATLTSNFDWETLRREEAEGETPVPWQGYDVELVVIVDDLLEKKIVKKQDYGTLYRCRQRLEAVLQGFEIAKASWFSKNTSQAIEKVCLRCLAEATDKLAFYLESSLPHWYKTENLNRALVSKVFLCSEAPKGPVWP